MIEDTYLTVWAEELVDTIVTSICDVISCTRPLLLGQKSQTG